jgi:hypothetical protein
MGTASARRQSMSFQGLPAIQGVTPRTAGAQTHHQSLQILLGCTLALVTVFGNFHCRVGRATTVFDLLGNILMGGANTADGEEDVFLEEILGEDLDVTRECGTGHEGLVLMNTRHILSLDNTMDLGFEAHVKHMGGLIRNKVTDVGQADMTTLSSLRLEYGNYPIKYQACFVATIIPSPYQPQ